MPDSGVSHETTRQIQNIEQTAAAFKAYAAEHGMTVSGDGRVSEKDAAVLVGYSYGYLKALRLNGEGPVHFAAARRSKVSYRMEHLAAWVEMSRGV